MTNEEKFNTYILPIIPKVKKSLRKRFKDNILEDVIQDAILKALKAIHKFDINHQTEPITWFYTIAVRVAISSVKRRSKMESNEFCNDEDPKLINRIYNSDSEPNFLVLNLLNILPIKSRQVMVLLSEGYDYKSISEKTDIPIGSVSSTVSNSRKKLKVLLKD